jgi:hypothetical protein
MTIEDIIREIVAKVRISKSELSRLAGTDRNTFRRFLKGEVRLKVHHAQALLAVLGYRLTLFTKEGLIAPCQPEPRAFANAAVLFPPVKCAPVKSSATASAKPVMIRLGPALASADTRPNGNKPAKPISPLIGCA